MVAHSAATYPAGRRLGRIPALVVAACACLLFAGCIYFRLLELKNQLANFDRYFETDLQDGVKIACKQPVLLDEDMAFFHLVPESRERIGVAERWHFRWIKTNVATGEDPRDYEVAVDFIFVRHKLARVILPERLFVFVPKHLFLSIVRAFGQAKIDKEKRTASASVREASEPGKNPPQLTQPELTALLGEPTERSETAAGVFWRYRYRAASASQRTGRIDITFTLHRLTGKVQRIRGRLFDVTLDVAFPDSTTPLPAAMNPASNARS